MKYRELLDKNSFDKQELLAFAKGVLVEDPPEGGLAQLPAPPFLMFDRVTKIERGERSGKISAEFDILPDAWFFQCHFTNDPVMPGCLGVDALWQLLGFYCVVNGAVGSGRALGAKDTEFAGQIRPYDKVVSYELDIRRFSILKNSGAAVVIGHGSVSVDGEVIYKVKDAKVGVFENIAYSQYPDPSAPNAKGGLLAR